MKQAFIAPRELLAKKARHGEPCTRCGLCCMASLCPMARNIFGNRPGPCPALSMGPEGSSCGLVSKPMDYAPDKVRNRPADTLSAAAKTIIGSDTGCDARFNGEEPNLEFYAELLAWDKENESKVRHALRVWGMKMKE